VPALILWIDKRSFSSKRISLELRALWALWTGARLVVPRRTVAPSTHATPWRGGPQVHGALARSADLSVEAEASCRRARVAAAATLLGCETRGSGSRFRFDEIVADLDAIQFDPATPGDMTVDGVPCTWFVAFGRCGSLVEKRGGKLVVFGSYVAHDEWIWGYEHGLVDEPARDLVVVSVGDLETALRALKQFIRRPSLDVMPALFVGCAVWQAIGPLRDAGDALVWRCE
jgi:hypothetical protein